MECAHCGATASAYVCSACSVVRYCGVSCQQQHWALVHARHHTAASAATRILPGLWVGGIEALDPAFLRTHRIGAVVTAISREQYSREDLEGLLELVPSQLYIEVRDDWEDPEQAKILARHFEPAARFIDAHHQKEGGVLVHCMAGHSRSVTLVLYYMLSRRQREFPTIAAALAHVQALRPEINVNPLFMAQLKKMFT